jgi:crotonobetainyl-CoA:carnitine CoA-transferase CaiB-like acyl-CoA transferase
MSGVEGLALLSGITVIDFTQALSGPFCTLMLADLGADVIKIERPVAGDDSRQWGPPMVGQDSAYFMSVNRNKRSFAADLKVPEDLAAVRDLVRSADVVVENWRPGTADRLGVGSEALRSGSPKLVYCSISGYGQGGAAIAAYDHVLQGTAGAMSLTGPPETPSKWGIPAADIASGMYAASAILAALTARGRTGMGCSIDIAMQDSLVSMLTYQAARYYATGISPSSEHNGHPSIAPYGTFGTNDGFVNVCVGNDAQFRRMCSALGRDDLVVDRLFTTNALRVQHKKELLQRLQETLSSLTTADVIARLEESGVPAGPVRQVGEVLDDLATKERDMILAFDRDDASGVRVVNTPWKFDGRAPTVRIPPPHVGQHNGDILGRIMAASKTGEAAGIQVNAR